MGSSIGVDDVAPAACEQTKSPSAGHRDRSHWQSRVWIRGRSLPRPVLNTLFFCSFSNFSRAARSTSSSLRSASISSSSSGGAALPPSSSSLPLLRLRMLPAPPLPLGTPAGWARPREAERAWRTASSDSSPAWARGSGTSGEVGRRLPAPPRPVGTARDRDEDEVCAVERESERARLEKTCAPGRPREVDRSEGAAKGEKEER